MEAELESLTAVQRLLRAKRQKGRRAKMPLEKPNVSLHVAETLADGTLGLGLDDAEEALRGLVVVSIAKKSERYGWQLGDRIVELNGRLIDDWEDFKSTWAAAKQFSTTGAVFGIVREGVEPVVEKEEPRCLHCGVKGQHLQRCASWMGGAEAFFCGRDCQKEAWAAAKSKARLGSSPLFKVVRQDLEAQEKAESFQRCVWLKGRPFMTLKTLQTFKKA